jgi:hypothetical protein
MRSSKRGIQTGILQRLPFRQPHFQPNITPIQDRQVNIGGHIIPHDHANITTYQIKGSGTERSMPPNPVP